MPPHSKSLMEEGAAIKSFKLVSEGTFQEEGITELLMAPARVLSIFECIACIAHAILLGLTGGS